MMGSVRKIIFFVGIAGFLGFGFLHPACAENLSPDDAFLQEVDRLRSLKLTNPEAYREIVQGKKEGLRNRLQEFREKRPERFREFLQRKKEFKRKRLEYFRQRHPEAFERFKEERRRRLAWLERNDPERFQDFLAAHPRIKERYEGPRRKPYPMRPPGEFRRRKNRS